MTIKLRVGDKVRILSKPNKSVEDWDEFAKLSIGKVGVITTDDVRGYKVKIENLPCYIWKKNELELINKPNMKEIKLSVEQARKMLGKDEAMDELIMANFSKEELKEKKEIKRWEDLETVRGYYVSTLSNICRFNCHDMPLNSIGKNVFATENQARGVLAMSQLSQLMKRFLADNRFEGWKPDWEKGDESKSVIVFARGKTMAVTAWSMAEFLAFPNGGLRDHFAELHKDLIMEYFLIYQ